MGDFKTYSPDLVTISWNGVNIIGFAKDTFIEIERDEDTFMKYTGALSDVARSKNLNKGGKVKITLMAVSPVNDILANLALADENVALGSPDQFYGPLQIKDLSGTMECFAEIAWIMKWPKVERGKESGTIEWEFDCAAIEVYPGGNLI